MLKHGPYRLTRRGALSLAVTAPFLLPRLAVAQTTKTEFVSRYYRPIEMSTRTEGLFLNSRTQRLRDPDRSFVEQFNSRVLTAEAGGEYLGARVEKVAVEDWPGDERHVAGLIETGANPTSGIGYVHSSVYWLRDDTIRLVTFLAADPVWFDTAVMVAESIWDVPESDDPVSVFDATAGVLSGYHTGGLWSTLVPNHLMPPDWVFDRDNDETDVPPLVGIS